MHLIKQFAPKSHPLGRPIAGLQIRVHRTCWPLLPLLVLLPPVVAPPGALAHCVATVVSLAMLGLAVAVQIAASVFLARRLGANPAVVLLYPFGPLVEDSVAAPASGARLGVWSAGPLANWVSGSLLTLLPVPLLAACGQLMSAYGLFSLAPCYPLAGGMILRELLGLAGRDDAGSDCRTLEVARVTLCGLAFLALLSAALPWLYALFVLWVIAHLALVPGMDLAGVRAVSVRWFQDRWTGLRRLLSRHVPIAFWGGLLWTCSGGLAPATDTRDFNGFQNPTTLQASAVSSLETNLPGLAVRLASLEQRREETTSDVAALNSAQQRSEQEVVGLASRLKAAEPALTATAPTVAEEMERGQEQLASSIQCLAQAQQQVATWLSQIEPRVADVQSGLAALQRQTQSAASNSELRWGQLQTRANQTDQALAVRDQKVGRTLFALTALAVIAMAALGVAAGHYHRRIQRLAPWMESRGGHSAVGDASTTQGSPCLSADRSARAPAPEAPPVETAVGVARSMPSAITPALYPVADSAGGRKGDGAPATVPRRAEGAILGKPVPEPAQLLRRLIALSQRSRRIRAKLSTGQAGPWTIGCATSRGPVRPKNEDYALAFEIAGCQVVLVADGVSGEPFAGPAAYLAIQSAAWSVIKQLGAARLWQRPDPTAVASQALQAAANTLSRIAAGCRCVAGLRTTLIVVVAARKTYGYVYIGDGKGCILRATGEAQQFLIPQRGAVDAANVIAACLGPTQLGSPVSGTLPRQPGDLLIVGTDGAFSETVELGQDYPKRLLRAAFHFHGDLQRTVSHVLQELSASQDKFGFLFDDNLTLALVGDGNPPRLAPGFWATNDAPGNPERPTGQGLGGGTPTLSAASPISEREEDQLSGRTAP